MAVHWTIVDEIRLLRWVSEFKPAGIHKHFHMFCIVERMNSPDKYPVTLLQKETMKLGKVFTAKDIWDKLGQSYSLKDIDEMENAYSLATITESSVNDNDTGGNGEFREETLLELNNRIRSQKQDFTLPWDEYGELILENAKKSPTSNEDGPQTEDANDENNKIPTENIANHLNNNIKEKKGKVVDKVKELSERQAKEITSLIKPKTEVTAESQCTEKQHKTEYMSDEDQNTKTAGKTAAPVRKSQRLKRNKEVKFEDEERENKGEEDGKEENRIEGKEEEQKEEKERKEQIEEVQKMKENPKDEMDEENHRNGEDYNEREKSTSYENSNGSESEEVDEALGYESERERDLSEKTPELGRDNSKKKVENKKDELQNDVKKDSGAKNEPLAKRTRHSSSAGNTSNETSPKRKRRKAGSRKNSPPATRVSSRLRNKK
ncbi:hypothetical protein SMKI_14G1860 [Saccharomyces mikatae IFO 1815]|uniref:Chromatin modification-related protein EAF7 n=1 Tax=Saccharomyces mikatae IFO 1815 TaxID=226126 RepID=A0AA35IV01_SACMI|nr:uncharacterized protein SMKI_14G1860 [Saccharomyces mikatae IFO 1815]CAI4035975.1 hypothetical protein SMKI_14G1860 [Saccharomyces mikatae IFO 1815]